MKTKIESFINLLHGIKWLQVFTIYLRYLIGIRFVYAFIWKLGDHLLLYQTKDLGKEVQLNPAFVFQSIMRIKSLWIAAAYAQLISGILLATQRFATLGAILFFPGYLMHISDYGIRRIRWHLGNYLSDDAGYGLSADLGYQKTFTDFF